MVVTGARVTLAGTMVNREWRVTYIMTVEIEREAWILQWCRGTQGVSVLAG